MVEVKMIDREPMNYLNEVKAQDIPTDDDIDQAQRRMKKSQKTLERFTEYRKKKYSDLLGGQPHKKNRRRFMSNATHLSKTDPVAKKSGKPRMLCYSSAMAVDTENNVITHISAEHASKKDSRLLLDVTEAALDRLESFGLSTSTILADAAFSSGENYFVLNHWGLNSFIPIHCGFKKERAGFHYHPKGDYYTCTEGQKLHFKHCGKAAGYLKKRYFSLKSICDHCSKRKTCVGKRGVKKIEHTIYREEYEEMIKRLKSDIGKKSYAQRMQTVEPVFGTLQQHYGLRWINARGKDCAHKIMLMAGAALNLKKRLKKITINDF
jgi:hypothetical protein